MRFDFIKNQYIEKESEPEQEFIIGSDRTLKQAEVLFFHNKLREKIISLNIPKGHPVCIFGEKEALFPVAMITLMSLDMPYIPIDVMMPAGRISNISKQVESKVLINCSKERCEVNFEIVFDENFDPISNSSSLNFPLLLNQDPIRYILFTSGSTGVPKGVQITATALNNFVKWYLNWPLIQKDCIFMNQAPFTFDISLCDLIGAFALGSRLVLNDKVAFKNGNLFLERFDKTRANTLVCTPSFLRMYLSIPTFNATHFPNFRQVIFIGEALSSAIVRKLRNAFPKLLIVNAYGPTEATVVVTYLEMTEEIVSKYSKSLPIGISNPARKIVILDEDNSSGTGEIGIIGEYLSIGYLKDIGKTDSAFINEGDKRIYRTGDLGYIKEGLIFYSGRMDSQVKLNGYRIELDEISNVLLTHGAIKNAETIAITVDNVAKKIVCYVILEPDAGFINMGKELNEYLLNYLPAYMIPSEIIPLASFPLNSNFKTDKKMLLNNYFRFSTCFICICLHVVCMAA